MLKLGELLIALPRKQQPHLYLSFSFGRMKRMTAKARSLALLPLVASITSGGKLHGYQETKVINLNFQAPCQ